MNDSQDHSPLTGDSNVHGSLDADLIAAAEKASSIANETQFSDIQRSQQELRFESRQASHEVDQWRNRVRQTLSQYRAAANKVKRIHSQTQKLQEVFGNQAKQAPPASTPTERPDDQSALRQPPPNPEREFSDDSPSRVVARDDPGAAPDDGGLHCSQCKRDLPEKSAFCLHCGAKVEVPQRQTACGSCGLDLPEEARFCLRCGARTSSSPQAKSQPSDSPVAVQGPPAPQQEPPVLAEPRDTPTPRQPPPPTGTAHCGRCGAPMQGKKFCTQCGALPTNDSAARANTCGRCQVVNKPNKKFCTQCGNSLK